MYDFHSLGIGHGGLEPRNVVRADDGKFLLIDFTESWMHRSKKCVAQHVGKTGGLYIWIGLIDVGHGIRSTSPFLSSLTLVNP